MPAPHRNGRRSLAAVIAAAVGLCAVIAWLSSIGGPHDATAGLVSVAYMLAVAGPPVLAYMLGAFGLGAIFRRWTAGARDAIAIECALGLALMLSLSHGLGVLGLLSGPAGPFVGAGVVLIGVILLARRVLQSVRASGGVVTGAIRWPVLLALPALALLLTAACNPPGWLWDSEHRGYDALSYHLQLPQEWIESGRIWPSDHNVYSYLPGYVEAAFTHIAAMTGAPALGRAQSLPIGLLVGEGHGVITCQLLHAAMAIFGAALVGRMVAGRAGRDVGALAGALFLSIPWVIVTGSLAYNEMGVAALFAGAMIAAGDPRLRSSGFISGFLVGVACGCKPTAIFMAAPVVGIALMAQRNDEGLAPWRKRAAGLAGAAAGGLVAIAPWLARNWSASGNPVFPMATGLFGRGPWTAEQVDKYSAGHRFDGSLTDRVLQLLSDDRGLLHPQWALLPAVALIAAIIALSRRHTRGLALILGLGAAAQVASWLTVTHLQSRFLLPMAVTGCALVGAGLAAIVPPEGESDRHKSRRGLVLGIGSLVCIGCAGMAIGIFSRQSQGQPNLPLLQSPWFRTGEFDRRVLKQNPALARELEQSASPEIFLNVLAPPGMKTYLLGEARGLYYTCPILYNVTWDKWPLGEAMRAAPDDHAAWTRYLWDQGVRAVLVNAAEVDRLHQSGWADLLVTNDRINAWLKEQGQLVRSWPEIGVAVFELRPPGEPR